MGKYIELNKNNIKENIEEGVALVDFWASWCGPCRKENINYKALNTELKNNAIAIVGFSLDNSAFMWKKALKEDNLSWLQLSDLMADKSPVVDFFKINSIPANIIIDHSGKIIGRNIPTHKLLSFIKSFGM